MVKNQPANAGDRCGLIPGLERSPGEGNSNPLQYSGLENPMDRETQPATVHGVTKSQAWLKQFSMQQWYTEQIYYLVVSMSGWSRWKLAGFLSRVSPGWNQGVCQDCYLNWALQKSSLCVGFNSEKVKLYSDKHKLHVIFLLISLDPSLLFRWWKQTLCLNGNTKFLP